MGSTGRFDLLVNRYDSSRLSIHGISLGCSTAGRQATEYINKEVPEKKNYENNNKYLTTYLKISS